MQAPATLAEAKWFKAGSFAFLLGVVAVFAYTGNYLWLVFPFAYLFVLLIGLNWKLAWWILLFTIPVSMQLDFMGNALSAALPDEPIMWLFFLLFPILWARKPDSLPRWWWRNSLVLVLVFQPVWLIVATAFSQELFLSIKYLISRTWLEVVFFIFPIWIFTTKKDFKRAFIIVLIPLLITMVVIMIRHRAIGYSFYKLKFAIGIIYDNHVDYSTVMSMFFPLLLIAYSLCRGKWLLRNILLVLIAFFLVAIYLTYARAAMLAVVFSLVVYAMIRLRIVKWLMPAIYALMALLLVYMISNKRYLEYRPNYNNTYMHKTFAEHMLATLRGTDMSSMERVYRWIAGVRMSTDHPLVGVGPNAFYYYYKPYAVTSFRTYVSRNPERSTTHNYFLYMLVEQGWPAMILYAILLMVMFAQAQKTYHRFKDRFYKKITIGIAMLLAASFVNNFFSELLGHHKVGALFYLGLGLLVVLDKKSRDEEAKLSSGDTTELP
jgi:O-antigen ligase